MNDLMRVVGPSDFGSLVRPDRIHGSVYTDQGIFEAELERVFRSGWVYVAHESEIGQPGDYVTRKLGAEPVIVSRDRDGNIHVLMNRCTHRGNLLCRAPSGSTSSYRCPYHGWTFANDGRLLGIPFQNGYGRQVETIREEYGLAAPGRVDSYGGFIFASLAPDGMSLLEHLGQATGAIDRMNRLSPTGKIELSAGRYQHLIRGNWKMVMENGVDGYHALFTHISIYENIKKPKVTHRPDGAAVYVRDLGGGHAEIDYSPEYRGLDEEFVWFGRIGRDQVPNYIAAMESAYGVEGTHMALVDGPPHALIFPNLFFAEMNVKLIEPISASETLVYTTPTFIPGHEEMNVKMIHRTQGALGPAGFITADDAEIAWRNQRGLAARSPEWLPLSRGLESDHCDEQGRVNRDKSTETPLRGFWREWRQVMSAGERESSGTKV
jgi:phenylpropionate dioxygenase-like ring-hydroxylating dioxygenase large terminal subunit